VCRYFQASPQFAKVLSGICYFLTCNRSAAAKFMGTLCFFADTYLTSKENQRQFHGHLQASAESTYIHKDGNPEKEKAENTLDLTEEEKSEEEKSDYKVNRLFEVKKGKNKENHWRGIELLAKDDKNGKELKSFDVIYVYCSLCDTSFVTITCQTVRLRQITKYVSS
jgi:hypothetical protein